MATLADSFLQDLDDLEDNDDGDQLDDDPTAKHNVLDETELLWMEPIPDAVEEFWLSQASSVTVISDLARRNDFQETMTSVRELSGIEPELNLVGVIAAAEYEFVEKCNQMVTKIDNELLNIHKFTRDVYSKKFPELEQIVYSPLEYIAVVRKVKNETNLTQVDLTDLLPNTVIMAVTVAASMTTGSPLSPGELDKVLGAADEAFQLADCRNEVLSFLESRMAFMAPNLSNILGSALAARLVTSSAGLGELARMPSQNLMLLGAPKRAWSSAGASSYGLLFQSEIVQSVPFHFRKRALRLVAGKCSLAARVDSFNESPNGAVGRIYREAIVQSLLKAQEPPPAPHRKALPIPDEKPKTRRAGKRYRRMKEKYAVSEFRKEANRLKFGTEKEEEYGLEKGKGFGMLGKSTGLGKLNLQVKQGQKLTTSKKRQLQMQRAAAGNSTVFGRTTVGGGGAVTSMVGQN